MLAIMVSVDTLGGLDSKMVVIRKEVKHDALILVTGKPRVCSQANGNLLVNC